MSSFLLGKIVRVNTAEMRGPMMAGTSMYGPRPKWIVIEERQDGIKLADVNDANNECTYTLGQIATMTIEVLSPGWVAMEDAEAKR